MNRLTSTALLGALALGVAACGSTATGGTAAKASPSPSPRVRNGAQGELVKITGTSLVLNATAGDVTVTYGASTTFVKTSTGSFADIAVGKCMVATGQKDAAGAVTASGVRLTDKVNGACGQGGPGGAGGGANPLRSPRPNAQGQNPNFAFASGEVTAVAGTTVTVKTAASGDQTVSVPTTVVVSKSAVAASSDLALHQCVAANGPRDASGQVTARTIQIVPAGPSGCFTGGGRGPGGFGRGNGGGGGGGAGPGAPPGD
ncbi:MAG TPA: hypothetical protein VIN56_08650 [Candidatus Dormibacteraeota bacterium]|jgi:hypothetical protein